MMTITLSPAMVARLDAISFPPEICGSSIEEKALFLIEDALLGVEMGQARARSFQLHRRFGVNHPDDMDDQIDL